MLTDLLTILVFSFLLSFVPLLIFEHYKDRPKKLHIGLVVFLFLLLSLWRSEWISQEEHHTQVDTLKSRYFAKVRYLETQTPTVQEKHHILDLRERLNILEEALR